MSSNSDDCSDRFITTPDQINLNQDALLEPQKEPDSSLQILLQSPKKTNGMKSDTGYLSIAFGIVSLPLVVISALLVILLFRYRIQHNQIGLLEFQDEMEADEKGVFYTTINSTTFVLLASFSSTLGHVMIGFFMSLLSYPISQRFLRHSRTKSVQQLPTPYQLTLLIGCLNANIMSLWRWLRYTCGQIRGKAADTLGSAAFIFLMINIITYAGYVLFLI